MASTATDSAAAAFAIATAGTVCDRRYGNGSTSLHVDYLWESKLVDGRGRCSSTGTSARAGGRSSSAIRARSVAGTSAFAAPLGLDLTFNQPSFLEVFVEIAPVFYVVPATFLALEGGLGVRGYFDRPSRPPL